MIWLILILVILLFGTVVFIGAPYLPTLHSQQKTALRLLNLQTNQTVLDIGSGDGRFLRYAAQQGYKAVGIEANPLLVLISKLVCWRYRTNVQIIWGDMWRVQWPPASGVYVFLHTRFMKKLDTKVTQNYKHKNIKLVSYAFTIPNKKIVKQVGALYLYEYK